MAGDALAIEVAERPSSWLLRATLRSYSQVLFSESMLVGGTILAATALVPRLLVAGLAAALLAVAAARLLRFDDDAIGAGIFGYNALLVGLGMAALLTPSRIVVGLGLLAVVASVLATGAIRSALWQGFSLPPLTLPFLLVFYLTLGAAPLLGQEFGPIPAASTPLDALLPEPAREYLRSLGAIFFMPRSDAGALVFVALAVFSRIGVLLSLLGYAIAYFTLPLLPFATDLLSWVIGYNFVLVAIALGGVWFVPGPASLVVAALGTLISGLFSLGLAALLGPRGIPLLILPFNLTIILMLYAMRQRSEDRSPKSVDFLPGPPEANLTYFQTRLARFGARHHVAFRAPFHGAWVVTQGSDGEVSHRGPWRHAFDFEVADPEGARHRGAGRQVGDYLCHRAPVLAAADGVVVRTVDEVPDNRIGELNMKQNWGNVVLVQHAPALYSMVAHLAPGSLRVREGQSVRCGDPLGACGNSGRSAVPHIHFQLQRTARPGDATLASELQDVIECGDEGDRLRAAWAPELGARLRNIERDERVAQLFAFGYREPIRLRVERAGQVSEEILVADIDVYGNLVLRSLTHAARLFYEVKDDLFVVYDTLGSRRSALHALHAALARVPFELGAGIGWRDQLPLRALLPWAVRPLLDLVSSIWPASGLHVDYSAVQRGDLYVVEGASARTGRDGVPVLETRAELSAARGIERLEMTIRGQRTVATRQGEQQTVGAGGPESSTAGHPGHERAVEPARSRA